MRSHRVLQGLLILVGLFFVAGIYPLLTSIPQHQQSDYGDQMMLAVYFVLGVFLLLAAPNPAAHRSLIAFTGWGTLAHDAVMAVQAYQLKQLRSESVPLLLVALLCVAFIALLPPRQLA
jgi:competence protein ComGC